MGLTADNKGSGDFQILESGTYAARCYGIIDIGTQVNTYQGEEQRKKQIILLFETPNELLDDGRPFGLAAFRTCSLHENAKLRKDLEAWRGREFTEAELTGFHLGNILGHACMISVTVTDKKKNKIESIGKLMKGLALPEAINTLVEFDMDKYLARDMDTVETYNSLPDWIKNKIKESDEVKHGPHDYSNEPLPDDTRGEDDVDEGDIPF